MVVVFVVVVVVVVVVAATTPQIRQPTQIYIMNFENLGSLAFIEKDA